MSQNTVVQGKPSLPTRLISAVLGSGIAYMAAAHFFALPFAIAAAVLVAAVGLIAPKWLLLPIAATVVPLYRAGKALSKEAYSGLIRGIFNGMLGLASSIGAAVFTATYLGWAQNLTVLLWFPACCIAFVVTFFILEPLAFLYVLKPIGDGLDWLWKQTREITKKYAKPVFSGIVNAAKLLPGSSSLWAWVENKEKGAQWVDGFMGFVTGVGVLGLTGTISYLVFNTVEPYAALVATGWIMTGLTWAAAGVVAIAMIGVLYQLLDKGEIPFVATALTAGAVYAAWPLTAALGFGLVGTIAIAAAQFVLGVAYVYPAVHGLLKTGLIKAILDGVKELVKKTYDEQDKDYRKFFAQIVTPVCALISGGLAYWALAFYGLPLVVVAPVALIVAFIGYAGIGEAFDDFPTTIATGGVLSVASGFGLWWAYGDAVNAYVLWPSLVLAVAAIFTVVLPLLYLGFRFVTSPIAKPAGESLGALNEKAYKAVRSLSKWWDTNVINKTYEDRSDYRDGFLHVFNVAVLALGVWQALPLAAGLFGLPGWATLSILGVSAALVYLILGRILLSVGVGAVGIAIGLGTFASSAWYLYQLATAQWWLAAIVAASFASVVMYVVAPVILLAVKALLGWLITPVGKTVLGSVYTWSWARFEVVWDAFVAVAKVVNDWVFQPFVRLIGAFFNAIAEAWNSMFGKR